MKRIYIASTILFAMLAVASPASAQLWLKDRAATQGAGIREGDFELHPGVAAEVGYDSNWFNRGTKSGLSITDTLRLRITPSFSISTLGAARGGAPPKVSLSAGVSLAYNEYLLNVDKLGRNRDFGINGDVFIGIAPGRPWSFNIIDSFTRTAQPTLAPDLANTAGLDRIDNRLTGELVHTKTGGLFDWRFGYSLGAAFFANSVDAVQALNNLQHSVYTRGRWRFLPRTALIYDASVGFIRYGSGTAQLADSTPIRTRLGLSGLITDRFAIQLMAGWGAGFYANATGSGRREFDSVIGQLDFKYYLQGSAPEAGRPDSGALSSFSFGFTRDFVNSYLSNYTEVNRGYLSLAALFAQRLYVSATAGFGIIRYSDVLSSDGKTIQSSFINYRVDGNLFVEYRVNDWLGFNVSGQVFTELSTKVINLSTGSGLDMNTIRFQTLGGVRAFF